MFHARHLVIPAFASIISFAGTLPEKEICAAAFESLFHRKVIAQYVRSEQDSGRTIHIFSSRNRPGDLDAAYIDGSQVIWRVEKAKGISKGRWRNHPKDERVFFALTNDKIVVMLDYGDGSKSSSEYMLSKLSKGIR